MITPSLPPDKDTLIAWLQAEQAKGLVSISTTGDLEKTVDGLSTFLTEGTLQKPQNSQSTLSYVSELYSFVHAPEIPDPELQ